MKTSRMQDINGKVYSNNISEICQIPIGGVSQYLMIRGQDSAKPVLLFVHGGPGQAEIGYIRSYQKDLEKHFVVVRWDQRGAGMSYSKKISKDTFNIDTFISDLNEVTDYLIGKFNCGKIILAGHSWGTIIATYAVKNNPNKYSAYIGIGQHVNSEEAEKIAYQYTKEQAIYQHNKKVIGMLEQIGKPPYSPKEMYIRAVCQAKIGGVFRTKPTKSMGMSLILSKEYSLRHKIHYQKACLLSANLLVDEISKVNLLEMVKRLEVPVLFIAGRYDYITPTILVEQFYKKLDAPMKELIIFQNSAHLPQLEEVEQFVEILANSKLIHGEH